MAKREGYTHRCRCCGDLVRAEDVLPGQVDYIHDRPKDHECPDLYGCGPVEPIEKGAPKDAR